MRINRNVAIGLAVVGLAIFFLAPDLAYAALPLLVLAACPLSMLLMMKMMSGGNKDAVQAGETATEAVPGGNDEATRLRAEIGGLRAERDAATSDDETEVRPGTFRS